jgi:DNA-directed RNA polymerase sigma subunit (sigma70/sigma32)/DNA-directed RNA polymerase specialized sigma24 family protein
MTDLIELQPLGPELSLGWALRQRLRRGFGSGRKMIPAVAEANVEAYLTALVGPSVSVDVSQLPQTEGFVLQKDLDVYIAELVAETQEEISIVHDPSVVVAIPVPQRKETEKFAIDYSLTVVDEARGLSTLDDVVDVTGNFLKKRSTHARSYPGRAQSVRRSGTLGLSHYKSVYAENPPQDHALVSSGLVDELFDDVAILDEDTTSFGIIDTKMLQAYVGDSPLPEIHSLPIVSVLGRNYHPQIEVDALLATIGNKEKKSRSKYRKPTPSERTRPTLHDIVQTADLVPRGLKAAVSHMRNDPENSDAVRAALLYYDYQQPNAVIADELDVDVDVVSSLRFRGVKALRTYLANPPAVRRKSPVVSRGRRQRPSAPVTSGRKKEFDITYSVTVVDEARGLNTLDDVVVLDQDYLIERSNKEMSLAARRKRVHRYVNVGSTSFRTVYSRSRPRNTAIVPSEVVTQVYDDVKVLNEDIVRFGLLATNKLQAYVGDRCSVQGHRLSVMRVLGKDYHVQREVDAFIGSRILEEAEKSVPKTRRSKKKKDSSSPTPEGGIDDKDGVDDVEEELLRRDSLDAAFFAGHYGTSEERQEELELVIGDHREDLLEELVQEGETLQREFEETFASTPLLLLPSTKTEEDEIGHPVYLDTRKRARKVIEEAGPGIYNERLSRKIERGKTFPKRIFEGETVFADVADLETALLAGYAIISPVTITYVTEHQHDLSRIVTGEGTIEFLLQGRAHEFADAYVSALHRRVTSTRGNTWPLHHGIQKRRVPSEKEGGTDKLLPLDATEEFCEAFEVYRKNKNPQTLARLFKDVPTLARGYVAAVAYALDEKLDLSIEPILPEGRNSLAKEIKRFKKEKGGWDKVKRIMTKSLSEWSSETGCPLLFESRSIRPFRRLAHDWEAWRDLTVGYMQLDAHAETARDLLAERNRRLIASTGKKYFGLYGKDFVLANGEIGNIRAAAKFDYTLGYRYATHAPYWIRQEIVRSGHDVTHTIRLPVHISESVNKMHYAIRELAKELDREPTHLEVQERLGWEDKKMASINRAQSTRYNPSLDAPIGDEESSRLGDFIEDEQAVLADARQDTIEGIDGLYQLIGDVRYKEHSEYVGFSARDIDVLVRRMALPQSEHYAPNGQLWDDLAAEEREIYERAYAAVSEDGVITLEEIGKIHYLSRERVRQIEQETKKHIRRHIKANRRHVFATLGLDDDGIDQLLVYFGEEEKAKPKREIAVPVRIEPEPSRRSRPTLYSVVYRNMQQALDNRRTYEEIIGAVDHLKPEHRNAAIAAILFYDEERSQAYIADELGVDVGAVGSLKFQGVKALRKYLATVS